jgi:hypothetical protein
MYGGYWAGESARALAPYILRSSNSIRSAMTWRNALRVLRPARSVDLNIGTRHDR